MADPTKQCVIERTFTAPRAAVWAACTEKDKVARWFGPGCETNIYEYEVKPGGVWQNEMVMKGRKDRTRIEFIEVVGVFHLVIPISESLSESLVCPSYSPGKLERFFFMLPRSHVDCVRSSATAAHRVMTAG